MGLETECIYGCREYKWKAKRRRWKQQQGFFELKTYPFGGSILVFEGMERIAAKCSLHCRGEKYN